jgi:hypothetical protein
MFYKHNNYTVLIGSIPLCFLLNIIRVGSVKTQLIYCQLQIGDMFRLKESSSGQFVNHIKDTSSKSAHLWDPKMFTNVRERGFK